MCIAIYKPEGKIVPEEYLQESFDYNPDGAGFMFAENNELVIQKGFMTYEEFRKAWEPHQEKVAALHFRVKTHGRIDAENTHPFLVGKHLGMVHNGIITKVDTKEDESKSDTYHFNKQFLSQLYKRDTRFIFKKHYAELIKEYIGHSKLIFLNNKGHHTIVNEKMGIWDDDIWYSNTSYKPIQYNPRRRKVDSCEVNSNVPTTTKGLYKVGSRLLVDTSSGKYTATLKYFGAGLTVGVEPDDTPGVIRMVYMGYCELIDETKEQKILPFTKFEVGDWVVRNDPSFGNTDEIGEVQGNIGQGIIVKFLNDAGLPAGPEIIIASHKLEHWYSSETNAFGDY